MNLKYVYTKRNFESEVFYDLVYEWEDDLANELKLSLYFEYSSAAIYEIWSHKFIRGLYRLFPFLCKWFFPSDNGLRFDMLPHMGKRRANSEHIIPCVIDFYLQEEQLSQFNISNKHHPLMLISSMEAYNYLLEKKAFIKDLNIQHFALSISDKYKIDSNTRFEKEYDLVLMGRQNPVLADFFNEYVKTHPTIKYVYRKIEGGSFNYYLVQNGKETSIGGINKREQYMALMRKARIGFYSTPDIDTDHERAHGFNQVTPRFLEWIACGAHVIARYMPNPDSEYYRLQDFSKPIETYEEFEKAMDYALTHEVDMTKYSEYLSHHYTSVRANELRCIINNL